MVVQYSKFSQKTMSTTHTTCIFPYRLSSDNRRPSTEGVYHTCLETVVVSSTAALRPLLGGGLYRLVLVVTRSSIYLTSTASKDRYSRSKIGTPLLRTVGRESEKVTSVHFNVGAPLRRPSGASRADIWCTSSLSRWWRHLSPSSLVQCWSSRSRLCISSDYSWLNSSESIQRSSDPPQSSGRRNSHKSSEEAKFKRWVAILLLLHFDCLFPRRTEGCRILRKLVLASFC